MDPPPWPPQVADHLDTAWVLSDAEQLPKSSTEVCSPSGWNTGAISRYHNVFDLPPHPQAPGVDYVERYQLDGRATAETVHYVFVCRARATITYCRCTTMGLEGRQEVAREVAAALAEAQDLPAPGRGSS